MKIANFYSLCSGRNDGPPLYYTHALQRRSDVTVIHLDPNNTFDEMKPFDGYLWVDWGEDALREFMPDGIPAIPNDANSIYISSDGHYSEEAYQYRLSKAKEASITFCNQSWLADRMTADGVSAAWLPHAVEPEAYPSTPVAIPKYDVGFVGHVNHPNRVEFLDVMFKAFPNFFFGKRLFEQAAEIYRQSKIVLNQALNNDLNMRVFEVCATKSFLLTPEVTDLAAAGFQDGSNCATYRTTEEAVEKAKQYLADDEARARIAQAGYELVMSRHTYDHRVKSIVAAFGALRDLQENRQEADHVAVEK